MENRRKVRYLIWGGGVTGLTFANFVDDYLVIEKEARAGGYCKTIRKGEYVFDYAGHFFHFKTNEWKNFFLKHIDEKDLVENEKNTKIYYGGRLIDYPFQMNIHELDKEEMIDCLYDLFTKEEKPVYGNFLEMLYGKFGRSITEKFLKPYNEKLYATNLNELDTDAMGRFFPYADKEQIIRNMKETMAKSYNETFLYPREGAERFVRVLMEGIDEEKVALNAKVVEVNLPEKYLAFEHEGKKEKVEYEYLVNTTPLNRFLEMVGRGDEAKQLSYNKVLVFNLGFDKKSKFTREHWIYVPGEEYNFYRVGFYDNILSADKLSVYVEIGFGKDEEPDVETELKKSLDGLARMGVIDDSYQLMESETVMMDPAYVHITTEGEQLVEKVMKELGEEQVYSIGRYGAWTYCSIEDCLISAKKLVKRLERQGCESV